MRSRICLQFVFQRKPRDTQGKEQEGDLHQERELFLSHPHL